MNKIQSFLCRFRKQEKAKPQHISGRIEFTTHFYDEIIHEDGTVELEEGHNLITNNMRVLLAALFASQPNYVGVQYWAVGGGPINVDPLNPPAPLPTDTSLATELARVPVSIVFVDNFGNATVGAALSTHVQVQATFGQGVATGANMEFGLFGGNAQGQTNGTGLLLNRVTHPVKYKNTTDVRRLTIIIDF